MPLFERPRGFNIVAIFDGDEFHIGTKVGGLTVQPMEELEETVRANEISIGIVAVPANQAQEVIDQLVKNKVRGILNYAPFAPQVPLNIVMRNIDPVMSLQSMTFYLRDGR